VIDDAIEELTPTVGVRAACAALGESRARHYRRHRKSPAPPRPERVATPQPRALSEVERKEIHRVLDSAEHIDEAPATVYAKLLDQGVYLGSVSTMYRILREHGEVGDRRRHATHPARVKPELVATRPNEVYSWDITKLHGPEKWTYYYLYSIIDIYSRYVPGWMLARAERASLAEALMAETIDKQGIGSGELTIHSDRGSPMIAKPVAHLLADLGVTKSHSRPYTSDDNPFSESCFKTLKYQPQFPQRFGSIQDAKTFCRAFFDWYNQDHHHLGIGLMTPDQVHYGQADEIHTARQKTLDHAFRANPNRFVNKVPRPPQKPTAVWINPPTQKLQRQA